MVPLSPYHVFKTNIERLKACGIKLGTTFPLLSSTWALSTQFNSTNNNNNKEKRK